MKVLLIEQAEYIQLLASSLQSRGFSVKSALSVEEAQVTWEAYDPDVVIISDAIGSMDIRKFCIEMMKHHDCYIIVTTSNRWQEEEIALLNTFADRYIKKPYTIGLLLSLLKSICRRVNPRFVRRMV